MWFKHRCMSEELNPLNVPALSGSGQPRSADKVRRQRTTFAIYLGSKILVIDRSNIVEIEPNNKDL